MTSSQGDFPFVLDPTPLVSGDETEVRRTNAGALEGYGLMHFREKLLGGELGAFALLFDRTGGVPGPAIQLTRHTHRTLSRALGAVSWGAGRAGPDDEEALGSQARLAAGLMLERNRLTDRFGEIGFGPRSTDDRTHRFFFRAGGEIPITRHLSVSALGTWTLDRYAPEDAFAALPVDASTRHEGAVGTEATLRTRVANRRLQVRASARMALSLAELEDARSGMEGMEANDETWAPTFRLASVFEIHEGLALAASAASGTRLPSTLELFGDRAYLLGDVGLSPERSLSADVSLVARTRIKAFRLEAEARAFGLLVDDLIRYARTSQFTAVPQNVGSARITGLELGLRAKAGRHVSLTSALTLLETEDQDLERSLPLRPQMQAHLRPTLTLPVANHRLSIYMDLTHVGSNYADPRNLVRIGGRTLFGAGVGLRLFDDRMRLAISVADLTDERATDVVGFPLPGRSFDLTLTLATEEEP